MFKLSFFIFCFILIHKFSSISAAPKTDNYLLGPIVEDDASLQFTLTKSRYAPKNNFDKLHCEIRFLNDYRLRVKCQNEDWKNKNFEVPIHLDLDRQRSTNTSRLYDVKFGGRNEDSLVVKVYRRSNQQLIFTLDLGKIVFSKNLVQATNQLSSFKLFGLGEHMDTYAKDFEKKNKTILLYNSGSLPRPDKPLYGSHPIYLNYENGSSNAHTVFFMNSNPMEIVLSTDKKITFKALGGVLDFFLNVGPTPQQAVQQYVSLVGKPPLVPYSTLGFHLCRWGYWSKNKTEAALQRTIDAKIPIDFQWNDIDYMELHNDFTISSQNFTGLKEFVEDLHKNHRKYALILDPGLPSDFSREDYPPFYEAKELGILMTHPDGRLIEDKVWNRNLTVFPDFTNPKSEQFWVKHLIELNKKVDYDLVWIDMNEVALLEDMEDCEYEEPEYVPEGLKPLHQGTACYSAKHHIGNHSDVHNIYAYFQANYTRNAMLKLNKRPFVLSRATFAGSGRFTSHWTGDVFSEWRDLRLSISNMLEFNILGIPVVGADICGFVGNTTVELCSRWSSLGAFYPFSRNHNTIKTIDQDPAALGPIVKESARYALRLRYSLLPLLYTELFKSSQDARPVAKAISMLYPEDEAAFVEDQFLWGDSLMVIPIVQENTTQRSVYLPRGLWYDYPTLDLLNENKTKGTHLTMDIPIDRIKLAIRGGSILFTQEAEMTTYETRRNNFTLVIALDEKNEATGDLYWDDGESMIGKDHKYSFVEAKNDLNLLRLKPVTANYTQVPMIDRIKITGLKLDRISSLQVNGNLQKTVRVVRLNSNSYQLEGLAIDLNVINEIKWQ